MDNKQAHAVANGRADGKVDVDIQPHRQNRRTTVTRLGLGSQLARFVAGAAVFAIASAGHAQVPAATPHWTIKPNKGFIDEAIAFDATGSHIAYIHTDSATFFSIKILDIKLKKITQTIPVKKADRVPVQLAFGSNPNVLVLVTRDSRAGKRWVTLFHRGNGKPLREIGPVDRAHIANCGGKPRVSLISTSESPRHGTSYRLRLASTTDLRELKRTTVRVKPNGTLSQPKVRILYWGPRTMYAHRVAEGTLRR